MVSNNNSKNENGGLIFLFIVIGSIFAGIQFGWAAGVAAFFLFGAISDTVKAAAKIREAEAIAKAQADALEVERLRLKVAELERKLEVPNVEVRGCASTQSQRNEKGVFLMKSESETMTDKEYYAAIEAMGHLLKRTDDGEIDSFVLDSGYHNGPGCELCHEAWCEHCRDKIEPCSVGVINSTC